MDKPLVSAQLEPTYRKGGECWSEGTGRGSSRAFLGTLSLKFVLETEEKNQRAVVGRPEGSSQQNTYIWGLRHSLGVSLHALPTPNSPSNPVQAPALRASFPKALGVEYFYREDAWSLPRIFTQEAFYGRHWLNPIIHNLWIP